LEVKILKNLSLNLNSYFLSKSKVDKSQNIFNQVSGNKTKFLIFEFDIMLTNSEKSNQES